MVRVRQRSVLNITTRRSRRRCSPFRRTQHRSIAASGSDSAVTSHPLPPKICSRSLLGCIAPPPSVLGGGGGGGWVPPPPPPPESKIKLQALSLSLSSEGCAEEALPRGRWEGVSLRPPPPANFNLKFSSLAPRPQHMRTTVPRPPKRSAKSTKKSTLAASQNHLGRNSFEP